MIVKTVKKQSRTTNALAKLNEEIEKGGEFPDLVDNIAKKHRIKVETLENAYDEQYFD